MHHRGPPVWMDALFRGSATRPSSSVSARSRFHSPTARVSMHRSAVQTWNAGNIAAIDFWTNIDDRSNELKPDNLQGSAAYCRGKRFTNHHPQDCCKRASGESLELSVCQNSDPHKRCRTFNNFGGQTSTKARRASWHRWGVAQGHENADVVSQRNIALCSRPDGFAFKSGIGCPRGDSSKGFFWCPENWMAQQSFLAIPISRPSGPSTFGQFHFGFAAGIFWHYQWLWFICCFLALEKFKHGHTWKNQEKRNKYP